MQNSDEDLPSISPASCGEMPITFKLHVIF